MVILACHIIAPVGACVVVLLAATWVGILFQAWITPQRLPLPKNWVGFRNETFGSVRTCFRESRVGLETMASGYREVRFPTLVCSALAQIAMLISAPVFKERAALHYAHPKL